MNTGTLRGDAPDVADIRARGQELLQQGEYDKAREEFQRTLNYEPDNADNHMGLAAALAGKGQWQSAGDSYRKAHALRPEDPRIQATLANVYLKRGRLRQALTLLADKRCALSYELGTRITQEMASSKRIREDAQVKDRLRNFRHLLRMMGHPVKREIVSHHIFANLLYPQVPWREKALDACSDEEIGQWVTWNGLDRLREMYEAGQGVILVHAHFAAQRVASLMLSRMGFPLYSIEWTDRLTEYGIKGAESIQVLELRDNPTFHLKHVYLAQKALKKGDILQMAGDGSVGQADIPVDFLGAKRAFTGGFAELAIASGAPAVPLFASVDFSGRISIDILEPMDAGDADAPREERVQQLVQRYAGVVEARWRSDPSNIRWTEIAKFLAPLAGQRRQAQSGGRVPRQSN